MDLKEQYQIAAKYIKEADGLLITGGAGMGVDSGLPDFRGNAGFWKAYPALAAEGCSFKYIAQPQQFKKNPALAWGFYGHRLNLYRQTIPHDGFRMLRELGEQCPEGYFVFTSNVDGQYQKSGFDPTRVLECHGSIHHLQCTNDCIGTVWSAEDTSVEVDEINCRAVNQIPLCPVCGKTARPNILMFDDVNWNDSRELRQRQRFEQWLSSVQNLVIIECGAGTAIPSVRRQGDYQWGKLIRINLREAQANKAEAVCIETTALEAIKQIHNMSNLKSEEVSVQISDVDTIQSNDTLKLIREIAEQEYVGSVGYLWHQRWDVLWELLEIQAKRLIANETPTRPSAVYKIYMLADAYYTQHKNTGGSSILPQYFSCGWLMNRIYFCGEGCVGDDLLIIGQCRSNIYDLVDSYNTPRIIILNAKAIIRERLTDRLEWTQFGDNWLGLSPSIP